ncbi:MULTISPECIES: ABC transporter substrate-binding protein [unclassified Oceanispirochaeta]|uniref:ABC transporter substrate-binding protein n=1 Tax=unclassified Oceanispirochaeta TaxID=2635722 RepID=UPI000E094368|nr:MULTISPECIES: ABC transporter substrate-binding protein [unclassified Oceanispirochaeta]MBF9017535.1 ABC transporter substrate-binding protein [Oceanispirochaeta sp. M2]NPD74107.1 ABC transporter substrate-binding protein [Oceanispirochaeta sp. M1]RDG30029.1 ABC transporter substrate-binding protein [Oceanispirochaeta sp. M1]
MKKLGFLLLVLSIVSTGLVFGSGEQEKAAGPVELNWYAHASTFNNTQEAIIAKFNETNPDITVNLIELPENTSDKLQALLIALRSGDGSIDFFNADVTWTPIFASAGLIEALDDHFPKSEQKQFLPSTIDAASYNGKIWGMPFRTDAGVLYYRKDLLEQYNKEVPATWNELKDTANEIVTAERAAGNVMYGLAGSMKQYEGLTCNAVEWFYSNGGTVLDKNGNVVINSPENVEILTLVKEMVDLKLFPEGILSYGSGDVRASMFQGNQVFMRAWPKAYALSQNPDNSQVSGLLGVAELPKGESGKRGHSTLGGWQLFLSESSKNKEAALTFMKFYSGEYAMKMHALNDSYLPARKSLYSDEEILKEIPFFGMIEDVLSNAVPRPKSPFYAETSAIIQVEVQNALSGKKSVEQALADAQAEMEKVGK